MTEPFVDAEVDRTKSKWVANTFKEFGKPKTTLRSLFYFALSRSTPDYPICGGFVGEIRIMRPYHESDGEKLGKWLGKAVKMGYVPKDAILEDAPREQIVLFASEKANLHHELWVNKSALSPLLLSLCKKLGVTLVSLNHRPSKEAVLALVKRAKTGTTLVFCLSDLSADEFLFCEDLAQSISLVSGPDKPNIQVKRIGLYPEQVVDLGIPMVPAKTTERRLQERFKNHLKPFRLDPRRMAELDALKVYHPQGLSGFVAEALSEQIED
jgi:hypothetical protein